MTIQGARGKIRVWEDFMAVAPATTVADATLTPYNELSIAAISGDVSFASTVDESGGVMSFSGAAGAGDGVALYCSPFRPSDNGTVSFEARWKSSSVTDFRMFMGFQETVAAAEPLLPFSLSGTTLTDNDAGEAVGFYFDSAATTDDYRLHASAAGVADTAAALSYALGGATTLGALGVRANATPTADRWTVGRIEIYPDGSVRAYLGDETMANVNGLTLIAVLKSGTLSATAHYFPILTLTAVSTGDPTFEVDYFLVDGNRDWEDN